jgi:hypothetical protein
MTPFPVAILGNIWLMAPSSALPISLTPTPNANIQLLVSVDHRLSPFTICGPLPHPGLIIQQETNLLTVTLLNHAFLPIAVAI